MNIYDIEEVKNPIVYISIAFISGSLFFAFLGSRYIWLTVLTVSIFFISMYLSTNSSFTVILLIFFSLSLLNNYIYYSINIPEDFKENIIITEKKSYYTVGSYKGRLVYIEGNFDEFKLGEKVNITGRFFRKENIENGVIGSIKIDKINEKSETFKMKLYKLRNTVYENLKNNIGERKSALVSSAAFGYTDHLDEEDKKEMRNFGVIHAVSVSGLHVALIYSVLKRLSGVKLSLLITVMYVMLTGAAFSSIRALIMITLLNSALILRKTYNPLGAIAFSAGLITLFKPYAPYDTGFELSFLAALGIILFSNSIKNKLYRLPQYLSDSISVSISAQVLTLPIMMLKFGQCSLLFLLGNLMLVPLLNLLIYLGNLMLVVVYIPKIFDFISFVTLKIINVFDEVTDYFYLIFSGSFFVNENIVVLYCFVLLSIYFFKKGKKRAKFIPLAVSLSLLLNIYSPFLRVDYLKEGGFLISYRGERKVVTSVRNVDMKKLKEKNMAQEGYRQAENISIGRNIRLIRSGKNFIINIKNKEYLLRINNKEKENKNYDIIDFVNKEADGFYIINDKLYCF